MKNIKTDQIRTNYFFNWKNSNFYSSHCGKWSYKYGIRIWEEQNTHDGKIYFIFPKLNTNWNSFSLNRIFWTFWDKNDRYAFQNLNLTNVFKMIYFPDCFQNLNLFPSQIQIAFKRVMCYLCTTTKQLSRPRVQLRPYIVFIYSCAHKVSINIEICLHIYIHSFIIDFDGKR